MTKLNTNQIIEALDRYAKGERASDIAPEFNIDAQQLRRRMKQFNNNYTDLKPKPKPKPKPRTPPSFKKTNCKDCGQPTYSITGWGKCSKCGVRK